MFQNLYRRKSLLICNRKWFAYGIFAVIAAMLGFLVNEVIRKIMPKNLPKVINNEYFLVCVDESDEFKAALEYACENAQKQKINLILLYIIETANFRHWKGVETIMQEEQKTKAKELLDIHLNAIKNKYKLKIKTLVKRGDRVDNLRF